MVSETLGENTLGSNAIKFNCEYCPENIGIIVLSENGVLEFRPSLFEGSSSSFVNRKELIASVCINGEKVNGPTRIYSDADSAQTLSTMTWRSLTWFVIKRGTRYAIRVKDSNSEVLKNFKGAYFSFHYPYHS